MKKIILLCILLFFYLPARSNLAPLDDLFTFYSTWQTNAAGGFQLHDITEEKYIDTSGLVFCYYIDQPQDRLRFAADTNYLPGLIYLSNSHTIAVTLRAGTGFPEIYLIMTENDNDDWCVSNQTLISNNGLVQWEITPADWRMLNPLWDSNGSGDSNRDFTSLRQCSFVLKGTNSSNTLFIADLRISYKAPSGLTVTGITNNKVELSWSDNCSAETSYFVYISNTPSRPQLPYAQTLSDTENFTITNLI
ncbi:MAG TPA: fibronectin type III domain-containing protein, partial [Spirochaetota bacterium]|nr:fibronectin type III domain-containing protein [Spirochaetota bacterium]